MALPTLNWKYIGRSNIAATGTVADVLDALYTLGTAVTYYDGSTRTPGSGSAWTFSRYQDTGTTEAVYATPPTTTALAQRAIWCGQHTLTKTPTMWIDTFTATRIACGINKNSGAFNAWDNASPFTSGQFSGYIGGGHLINGTTDTADVDLYESQEAIIVGYKVSSQPRPGFHAVGALRDPFTTGVSAAETDGRRYGVASSGIPLAASWTQALTPNTLWHHATGSGQSHNGDFAPGGSAMEPCTLTEYPYLPDVDYLVTPDGVNVAHGSVGQVLTVTGRFSGALREIRRCRNVQHARVFRDGSTDKGYAFGAGWSGDGEAMVLLA